MRLKRNLIYRNFFKKFHKKLHLGETYKQKMKKTKKKTKKKAAGEWKLSVSRRLRLIIDLPMIFVFAITLYVGLFNRDMNFLIVMTIIPLSYLLFIYKGFYRMRVEMGSKEIILILFPFVRFPVPYKKIKSIDVEERKWREYLLSLIHI